MRYCDNSELEKLWVDWQKSSNNNVYFGYFRSLSILWTHKVETSKHCLALCYPVYFTTDQIKLIKPPSLIDDFECGRQELIVIPELIKAGYVKESTPEQIWKQLLLEIHKMCNGIAIKLRIPEEEKRIEVVNEAVLQVALKIKRGKIQFIAGKAPLFNLLTTTITRIIYTYLSKSTKRISNTEKLYKKIILKAIPNQLRSFKFIEQ